MSYNLLFMFCSEHHNEVFIAHNEVVICSLPFGVNFQVSMLNFFFGGIGTSEGLMLIYVFERIYIVIYHLHIVCYSSTFYTKIEILSFSI